MARPYLIGLTGNIACGKSTVLRELRRLGAATIDADAVAHQVMRRGTAVHAAIVRTFGPNIVQTDGEIDRRALGRIVFGDPQALGRLEAIVHPAVIAHIRQWLQQVRQEVAVVDAIKLLESGLAAECDEIWVVTCPQQEQLRRLVQYRGLPEEEAWMRILAQPPQEEKIARADVVIDNSGSRNKTRAQVRAAWQEMQRRRQNRQERPSAGRARLCRLQNS